jgi:hypothetical protein
MAGISRTLQQRTERTPVSNLSWCALLVIVLLSAGMRYGLLEVPLDRDEGEYAYAGQLILQGIPPYQQLYNMKLPGIYIMYAGVLAAFGQTHTGVHLGLLITNAATIVLLFLLAKWLIDPLAGVVAAACFAVLSVGQPVLGVFAKAEHFVILWALGGLVLMLVALDVGRPWLLFCSGLLFGISFLMKQHGVAFVALGGLYILINQLQKRARDWLHLTTRCALFTIGVAVPYGLTCLILELAGVFGKFWFWTVDYAMAYTSQVPIDHAWACFKKWSVPIGGSAPLIWSLVGLGLTALVWDKRAWRRSIFIVTFAVSSLVAICPGFYFRPHYFVMTLPAAALLAGIAISAIVNILSNVRSHVVQYGLPILLAIICLTVSVYQQRRYLFQMTPMETCRATYGLNPFPESLEIGRFIRKHTKDDERIAVIGSEPQIYFYSRRRSASGYIYMYSLMEKHGFAMQMQKEMIREIESAQPRFLIFVRINTSWLQRPESHKLLFEWFHSYQAKHYSLVGLVDLFEDTTFYHWAPNVKWPPRSRFWIAVLKRKD